MATNVPNITLQLKDVLIILTYVIGVISFFFSLKYHDKLRKKEIKELQDIVLPYKGASKVVNPKQCKEHRDNIHSIIRVEGAISRRALMRIDTLSENMQIMMLHMGLEPKRTPRILNTRKEDINDSMD